jgi:outer membrane receptor protein involved in Fe transport
MRTILGQDHPVDQVTFFSGEDYGRYFFDGSFSSSAFADFFFGLPTFTSYAQNAPDVDPYTTQYAFYAQDDWRPASKLTINYGVRYDLRPPMLDRSNQLGNFDRDYPGGRVIVANSEQLAHVPPALRAALPNTPFVTAAEAGLNETLRRTDKNNSNPRVGIAYRPTDTSVVRGGFGAFLPSSA